MTLFVVGCSAVAIPYAERLMTDNGVEKNQPPQYKYLTGYDVNEAGYGVTDSPSCVNLGPLGRYSKSSVSVKHNESLTILSSIMGRDGRKVG